MDEQTNIPTPEHNQESSSKLSAEQLAQSAFQKDTAPVNFAEVGGKPQKTGKHRKFSLKHLSKKQKILLGVGVVLALGLIGFLVWRFALHTEPQQPVAEQIVEVPASTTEASRVTGLQVKPEINQRHVNGVMIENSPDARPQSGLNDADIVYEAVAEGGITRFLAMFHDKEPKYVGPIRSARPYYIHWLLPFDASYAHVGGSPDALRLIKQAKVKDLDQFANSGAYERVSSRYAPHNVYSGIDKLNKLEEQKNYKTSNVLGFARKATETPAEQVKAATINLSISSALYNVSYKYGAKGNQYARYMGGKKHVDEKSGKQIYAKVVVALVMKKGLMPDGHHTKYATVGSGRMFVFQDGIVVKGKWKKDERNKQFSFTADDGTEIQLNPGNTWITIVSDSSSVSYKP